MAPSTEPIVDPMAVQRGNYKRTLAGPLLFAAFRILSHPLQHFILASHPLSIVGIPRPPTGGLVASSPILSALLPQTWLSQPLFPFLGTTVMPGLLQLKHVIWISLLCRERFLVPFAFFAGLSDNIYEAVTTLVFSGAAANPLFMPSLVAPATAINVIAGVLELLIEIQRAAFKRTRGNENKLCKGGLWGWVRHPNFALNIIYGFAYGLAAGGPLYALCTGGMYFANFTLNAVPSKEEYLAKRYGEEWEVYKKETKWKLFPGVW